MQQTEACNPNLYPCPLPLLLPLFTPSPTSQASSWGAVQQLEACGVTLSKVVRLGGHSAPRTRSNPAGPNVGFAIIKAVSSCLQQQPGVQVLTGAQVTPTSCTAAWTALGWCFDGRLVCAGDRPG
jgi:hypothetical protein